MSEISELVKRFAEINGISETEAAEIINNASSTDEALERIKEFNLKKIRKQNPMPRMNRKQRRALEKKYGKSQIGMITDAAEKLNYIDLIQKFRALNKKREEEEKKGNEDTTEDN